MNSRKGPRAAIAHVVILSFLLYVARPRSVRAEDRLDFKTMYYQEGGSRVHVFAPTMLYEKTTDSDLTIKVDCIFNSISGATPTGAPPEVTITPLAASQGVTYVSGASEFDYVDSGASPNGDTTSGASPGGGDDDDDDEREDEVEHEDGDHAVPLPARFPHASGASSIASEPQAAPPADAAGARTGKVPMTEIAETRVGLNLEVAKRLGDHTPAAQLSFSTEHDYQSYGLALRDAVDFNQKNTTLTIGGAYTYDTIKIPARVTLDGISGGSPHKRTLDALLGISQLLGPKALATVNLTLSRSDGYLGDPYKVVQLDTWLVPEKRPDTKDKQIVFASLLRYVESLRGSAEVSYRWYQDSFGIMAHTIGLAWYQKLGEQFTLRPSVRLYDQTAADFYAVRFTGTPEYYSSDYRLSALQSLGYGLKAIWKPHDRFAVDMEVERYEQRGKDSSVPEDNYPTAIVIMFGARVWF